MTNLPPFFLPDRAANFSKNFWPAYGAWGDRNGVGGGGRDFDIQSTYVIRSMHTKGSWHEVGWCRLAHRIVVGFKPNESMGRRFALAHLRTVASRTLRIASSPSLVIALAIYGHHRDVECNA